MTLDTIVKEFLIRLHDYTRQHGFSPPTGMVMEMSGFYFTLTKTQLDRISKTTYAHFLSEASMLPFGGRMRDDLITVMEQIKEPVNS